MTHVVGSAQNTVVQLVDEESLRDRDSEFLGPWSASSFRGEVQAAKARISAALERPDARTLGAEHAGHAELTRDLVRTSLQDRSR